MAEIGSQDNPIIGSHRKNTIRYQKNIDDFVPAIKAAMEPFTIPPENDETYYPAGNVNPEFRSAAAIRTVGGMSTHWTTSCPVPHEDERVEGKKYVPDNDFDALIEKAGELLKVSSNQYDESIRHTVVRAALEKKLSDHRKSSLANLDLAVERRADNADYVTWSGANTILGNYTQDWRLELSTEKQVTNLIGQKNDGADTWSITGVVVRDLNEPEFIKDKDGKVKENDKRNITIKAKAYVLACGAICTPQILWNSRLPTSDSTIATAWNKVISPTALGRYLCSQSLAFCQIILSKEILDEISKELDHPDDLSNILTKEQLDKIKAHKKKHPNDTVPIPFMDPEPQLTLRYLPKDSESDPIYDWHAQIHRDAFSYGKVGYKADSRLVVDLRWFGKSASNKDNRVEFGLGGVEDSYGMPQPTFTFNKSRIDGYRDIAMIHDMHKVAQMLGDYAPGSSTSSALLEPGLAQHITGTTRMGDPPADNESTSVVDADSRVHGIDNLWLGGCNVIPDSMACSPTRTAIAYAIKSAKAIAEFLPPQVLLGI